MNFLPLQFLRQSEVTVLAPALFRQPNTILMLFQAVQHHDERRALVIKRHDTLLSDMEFLNGREFLVDGAGALSPRGGKSA
ncbi:hypothetical protein FJW07_21585 [Mesorhizobium sp. B3-1-9]|uniref:hypothetical protein n=1 Tax=unclassified Mesorhizobium TaxID=325217 RepID=UPI00112E195D|nr:MULTISPECIES: hypothetical protein [unclassified Mesorhizobium]TPI35594.1 hypothetical protein FJ414_18130 [Mesorhizobium sp. B3-1-6]TPI36243.1 hypothetical protein FJW07_21585 [Mesorhizobium sp. B3-1-9]TPI64580.1 hypothetical protein FJ417_02825 [Mesorhizobium sp. B3-1-7]TPI66248.1 hypothetical protein FJ424_13470 [Mesorhizobium sp. B3-1-8]TPI73214.1 hypothetical protein FJ420_09715 [Mesorhizobium sp. B3-1-3]